MTTRNMSTSNARFFDVLSDLVCASEHGSTSSQIVCLGLSNLHHPLPEPDVMPFYMLSTGTPFPSISTCPDSSVAPSPKSNEDSRTVPFSPTEGLDTQRSIPWIIVSFAEGPALRSVADRSKCMVFILAKPFYRERSGLNNHPSSVLRLSLIIRQLLR